MNAEPSDMIAEDNLYFKDTMTLTFGDQAENHVGMQKIGKLSDVGFTESDMLHTKEQFESRGYICELMDLSNALGTYTGTGTVRPALILVIRSGVNMFSNPEDQIDFADQLYEEQSCLTKDTQALMYGRVVNKHARHNLCFAETAQEPDYKNGKGRIVDYATVPHLARLKQCVEDTIGESASSMAIEGNYYFDTDKCGIGYHGDSERRKVVGVRLGGTIPLCFAWFYKGEFIQDSKTTLWLNHGDMYMMSETAAGFDWKKKTILTLRHAAGCDKYTRL